MAQIGDANPAVAAASLRRLYDATGIGILLQDYPVVSGITVSDEQVVDRSCGVPLRGRGEIRDATDVRGDRAPGAPARRSGVRRSRRRRSARRTGRGLCRRDDRVQSPGGAGRRAARAPTTADSKPPVRRGRRGCRWPTSRGSCGSAWRFARRCCAGAGSSPAPGCDDPPGRCPPRWCRCWTSICRAAARRRIATEGAPQWISEFPDVPLWCSARAAAWAARSPCGSPQKGRMSPRRDGPPTRSPRTAVPGRGCGRQGVAARVGPGGSRSRWRPASPRSNATLGPVDILVNNTGGPPPTPAAGQDAVDMAGELRARWSCR